MKMIYRVIFLLLFSFHAKPILNLENKTSTLEIIGENSDLTINSSIKNFSGTLKLPSPKVNETPLHFSQDAEVFFENGSLILGNKKQKLFSNLGQTKKPSMKNITKGKKNKKLKSNLKLSLSGGKSWSSTTPTEIEEAIEIVNKDNLIEGWPILSQPIKILNKNSELKIGIKNKLNQDIDLNGGKVVLEDDLLLKDDVCIIGSGIIDVNNFTLKLPRSSNEPLQNKIEFRNAQDIELTANTTLSSTWSFSGEGTKSLIKGNGYTLDISGGGILEVLGNHTLELNNVHIKGLGTGFGNITMDANSTIEAFRTNFELSESYAYTQGKIKIAGPGCQITIRGQHFWTILAAGILEIDGYALKFVALGGAPIFPPPFLPMSGGTINYLNGGTISSRDFDLFKGVHFFTLPDTIGPTQLTGNVDMSSQTIIRVVNENVAQPKNMTLNANGFAIRFTLASPGNIIFDENVDIVSTNLIIDDLDFSKIDMQGSGATKAKFRFGNGTIINLARQTTVDSIIWPFTGDASIDGNNNYVDIIGSEKITVTGNSNLKFESCNLKIHNTDSFKCLTDDATITFKDCNINIFSTDFNFDTGNLAFEGINNINHNGSSNLLCTFEFSSKGNLTIASGATLLIDQDVTLKYNPDTSLDGGDSSVSKRHLKMTDSLSALHLTNSTLDIGSMGLAIDYGNICVVENVDIKIPNSAGSEFEIGSAVNVNVSSGGSLNLLDGEMIYTQTTAP